MLLCSVRIRERGEVILAGNFPDVVGQVTMDELARDAFSENWKLALENGFASRVRITFPKRSRFSSGF